MCKEISVVAWQEPVLVGKNPTLSGIVNSEVSLLKISVS